MSLLHRKPRPKVDEPIPAWFLEHLEKAVAELRDEEPSRISVKTLRALINEVRRLNVLSANGTKPQPTMESSEERQKQESDKS